ncbi:hypothetical protein G6O67_001503 [Ophiocordyceps sinensis]|uniref:HECT-type E3 ubiquitin transferase n=1 Tax=Ophiocordyceps sinensis TaxID=72228 RepID=A0A8H4PXJ8_9HYPO|nr:hypothetical protein G6O67_001503 [Ophiocordyceps sinensis]
MHSLPLSSHSGQARVLLPCRLLPTAAAQMKLPPLFTQHHLVTRIHNDARLTPTTFLGRVDISNQHAPSDSSSSESDILPSRSTDARSRHGRSMSNPFPSLFNTKKKRRDSAGRGFEPECDPSPLVGHSPRRHTRGGMAGSKDFATGHCMTCASLVKWPKELKVFKCTICSTINHLVPVESESHRGDRPSSRRRDASRDPGASGCQGQSISIQHSKWLTRQCLHSFLARRLCAPPQSSFEARQDHSACPPLSGPLRPAADARGYGRSPWDEDGRRTSDDPPAYEPRDPSASRQDEYKRIFKPLADYIVTCFGSVTCVNSSFMTSSRPTTRHAGDLPVRRKPVPSREPPRRRQAAETSRAGPQADGFLSELDPKMLLLGDFAENELSDWYSSVINAAEGWFEVYEEVSRDPDFLQPAEKDLETLEGELLRAQTQLQRVLLKATEQLLKRPGRPLAAPVDLRFLLVLLENPLLHPDLATFEGLIQPQSGSAPKWSDSSSEKSSRPRTGLLSGQHSGIIKRIVGLLSNSSTECHNHLISWLAEFPTARFVRAKDIVSGFLTYRLLRQSVKTRPARVDITAGLIPEMQVGRSAGAYLHDEIGSGSSKKQKESDKKIVYADDWQIKAAARVLALFFAANNLQSSRVGDGVLPNTGEIQIAAVRDGVHASGQLLPTSDFYNLVIDNADLVGDFESWESKRAKFSFCQYPFLLSIWAKTKILEYDARRQMQNKARDAFFDSIMTRRNIKQYLSLDVRRECLVDDSLKAVGEVIGSGSEDVKKALRITFRGEEGIDGGGLRKEWFLLLVREVFNPDHGMFLYDEDSRYCYFNPNSFETSDQFFLVGVVMGLAIYNSTILDVALPPFTFRKLLASAPCHGQGPSAHPRPTMKYTLDDLAEYKPRLARGLRQLLDYDGDVEHTFSLDFVVDIEKYGTTVQVPLCPGGGRKPVTNGNRREYVDLYLRHVLDAAVARQYEPFKRGFYTVCGGNAFSLFRPEEIELLIRGSDAPLDIEALRAVAEYDNWGSPTPDGTEAVVGWFWETFQSAAPADQRSMLLFVTGSDRIPAMGASMLTIKISCLGEDCGRFPIARTCFNLLSLWRYGTKDRLEAMLWRAVRESEGFGLK